MASGAVPLGGKPMRRRRFRPLVVLLVVAVLTAVRREGQVAWLSHSVAARSGAASHAGAAQADSEGPSRRQLALVLGPLSPTLSGVAGAAHAEQAAIRFDEFGRVMMPDGTPAATSGKSYEGVASFLGKPKVFVSGSTGELGRRVAYDLLRSGYSVYVGFRDNGRGLELQYDNRKTARYEETVVPGNLIETGRTEILVDQLADASVVIHTAGARFGFDILRPLLFLDPTEPERTDLNGTKALVDAAVAKGVKKFIYVSAILTNARALGEEVYESDAFKNWNNYGDVLDKKHEAEEYVKASGLDYTIIRPAPMTNDLPRDMRGGIWFGAPDTILLQKDDVGSKISREDVSLACMDAIFNEKASRGTFELVSADRRPPTPRSEWWVPNPSGKKTAK